MVKLLFNTFWGQKELVVAASCEALGLLSVMGSSASQITSMQLTVWGLEVSIFRSRSPGPRLAAGRPRRHHARKATPDESIDHKQRRIVMGMLAWESLVPLWLL